MGRLLKPRGGGVRQKREVGAPGTGALHSATPVRRGRSPRRICTTRAGAESTSSGPERQDGRMRIVSLLPSATEIVYALGLGDHLLGVTHECDWPPEARAKRVVSRSTLPVAAGAAGAAMSPGEIDRLVGESVEHGGPLYPLGHNAGPAAEAHPALTPGLCSAFA